MPTIALTAVLLGVINISETTGYYISIQVAFSPMFLLSTELHPMIAPIANEMVVIGILADLQGTSNRPNCASAITL